MKLEICAGDIASARAAAAGGADRVELCSALGEGGLTPSIGLIKEARKVPGLRLHVLIRPREGDFVYDADEVACMAADIRAARDAGADGVVIGALTAGGDIDLDVCRRLICEAEGMSVTFHRAFDRCRDPFRALEEIVSLGCDRLLTSGQAASAYYGIDLLRQLVEHSAGRISIMAGAGITPGNVAEIVTATGVDEVHASARVTIAVEHSGVKMGENDLAARKVTSALTVGELKRKLYENE